MFVFVNYSAGIEYCVDIYVVTVNDNKYILLNLAKKTLHQRFQSGS